MYLCEYGCGAPAIYENKSGKMMCCEFWQQCPKKREETSKISKESHNTKEYKQQARENTLRQFSNETEEEKEKRITKMRNTCRSEEYIKKRKQISALLWQDSEYKTKMIEIIRDFHKDNKYREKLSKSSIDRFKNETDEIKNERIKKIKNGSIEYFKNETNEQKKYRIISKKRTIEKLSKKYPIFIKEEEMRYNPDKPEEKEIQVHCKNNNCSNSKENGGWFTPYFRQIEQRLYGLDNNRSYFYCSDKCKIECNLFNLHSDPYRLEEYEQYIGKVYKETYKSLKKYSENIKAIKLRGRNKGYDLDHKFSIYDGYIQQISPEIIGHWKNLIIIKASKNRKKGKKSSISLKKLLNEIKGL